MNQLDDQWNTCQSSSARVWILERRSLAREENDMDVVMEKSTTSGQSGKLVMERLYPALFGGVALRLADKGWIPASSYARSGAELQFRAAETSPTEDFSVSLLPDAAAGEVFVMIKGRRINTPIEFTVSVGQDKKDIDWIIEESLAQAVALVDPDGFAKRLGRDGDGSALTP
jgi:hypothetical protein